ncbi:MAG: lamin tail domain-containing protein [DPANN group archaeon]|nr:lamin tail domain-containing protein [DPANN group archaeon]
MAINIIILEINLFKDYVKLKNNSVNPVNLRDWKLIDSTPTNQKRHKFIFPKDFFLQPNATVKIWSGVGKNNINNIYQNRRAKIWNNLGDTATFYDSNGNKTDEITVGAPPKGGRGEGAKPPKPPKQTAKITISGFVNDGVCSQPITNAELTFQPLKGAGTVKTNSDDSGYYKAELNGGQDYTVTVSAKNYDDFPDTINTKVGKDITKNFKLNPNIDIELGVDSTEVKFTRKDDNLINVVKQLTNKITVDFNTDYTFTAKISLKKGTTNEIRGTLVENNKKDRNIKFDDACRIGDGDKALAITFDAIKNNWKWYKFGWFWWAEAVETEKTFNYSVSLLGKYGNNKFGPVNTPIGKIVVKVNKEKLNALNAHNLLLGIQWAAGIGAIIAAIVAAIFILPAIAVALGISVAAGAAGVNAALSGLISGSLAAAWGVLETAKQTALKTMDDPPKFDKNYNKLVRMPLKTASHRANIKRLVLFNSAIVLSRDRLYSAQLKGDRKTMKKQLGNISRLLKGNQKNVASVIKLVKDANKNLHKYKTLFSQSKIAKLRKAIRAGKVPKKVIFSKLKKYGFSKTQLDLLFAVAKSRKVRDKNFLVLPKLRALPRAIEALNKSFVTNIKREVAYYAKQL